MDTMFVAQNYTTIRTNQIADKQKRSQRIADRFCKKFIKKGVDLYDNTKIFLWRTQLLYTTYVVYTIMIRSSRNPSEYIP